MIMAPSIEPLLFEADQHQKKGRPNQAIAIYQRILNDASPDDKAIAHHHLANLYASQNNNREALQHYRDRNRGQDR